MTLKEAVKVLSNANKWRRDDKNKYTMPEPKEFGEAIDIAINLLKYMAKSQKATEPIKTKATK